MIKRAFISSMVLGLVLALGSGNSFAKKKKYEGGAGGSGTLSGTISYKGGPKDITIDFTKNKNPEFCVTHPDADAKTNTRVNHKIVSKGGKLQDAIVFIQNIEKGKDWPVETVKVDFKNCDIHPRMFGIRKTTKDIKKAKVTTLIIENHDPEILHNPHGYSIQGANRKTLFNKPLPSKGSTTDVTKNFKRFKPKKDKHFFIQCDQHNFMETDGRVVWNPYFSVTGADGSYKIDGIPDGKYNVCAWHPYAGKESCKDIDVKGAAKANFEIK